MSIEGFLQAVIEDVIDDAGSSVNEDTTSDYLEGLLDGKTSVMRFLSQHGIITERQYGDFLLESGCFTRRRW